MPQMFHIEEDELIQYALASLKEVQLSTLTAHVSICSECRARLGAIHVEMASYAAALPEEGELPARTRQRFLSQLSGPAAQESRLELAREQGRPVGFVGGVRDWFASPKAPWVLSGVLAVAVIFLVYDDSTNVAENRQMIASEKRLESDATGYQQLKAFLGGNETQQVTLHQSNLPSEPPQGHVMYSSISGQLVFTAANMQAPPPGKIYALWLMPASGAAPILAGSFVPDLAGNGAIVLPELPQKVSVKGFGVSVEPAGGASKPTLPLVLYGQ